MNQYRVLTTRFNDSTDKDGQLILGQDKQPARVSMADHRDQGESRLRRRRSLRLSRLHRSLVQSHP